MTRHHVELELPGGYRVRLEALVDVEPRILAAAAELELDAFLDYVDRWARYGDGFLRGIVVDRAAGTIRRRRDEDPRPRATAQSGGPR